LEHVDRSLVFQIEAAFQGTAMRCAVERRNLDESIEDNSVGRPAPQAFVGAVHGQQADRGVLITTARLATTPPRTSGSSASASS
jgi:hypothetical protein